VETRCVPQREADGGTLWYGFIYDISERKRAEILATGQNRVLERIASGMPLTTVLEDITGLIEQQIAGAMCSILLLDDDELHLHNGAANSLPAAYNEAIDGIVIGPHVGSCGTAVYRREAVIVADITRDPLWQDFRVLALQHDLQACWSYPIFSSRQEVLGTFALYFPQPYAPTDDHAVIITRAAYLAGVAIERNRDEKALFAEKERAQVTLQSIADAVISTDDKGYVEYLNPVAETLTGWTLDEARSRPLSEVIFTVDEHNRATPRDPVARCLTRKCAPGSGDHAVLPGHSGQEYIIEESTAPIRDRPGNTRGVVVVFRDVTSQRRLAQEITHQATHDALTGLLNRRAFEARLSRVIDTTQLDHTEHALCYLDLDQFKVVNDTCGHAAGDELLRQLAGLLKTYIRHRDTLARLGGDEFGLLLEHCLPDQAGRIADSLRQAVEDYLFVWEAHSFRIGISIGLVPITSDSGNLAAVLQAADSTCYVAKDSGRNRIQVYTRDNTELAQRQGELQWVNRIQEALEHDRFELYAQRIAPVRQNAAGRLPLHFELLLRLVDNAGDMILPGAFMPAAERYHLAIRIDRWVVERVLRFFAADPHHLSSVELCAINLSGHSFSDPQLQTFIVEQLEQFAIPPAKLCFEITETAAIANLTYATRFITLLKTRGCRFALDDFGSGLSSFAYLKNLPVDFLKINGAFVKDIATDPIDLAMVRSINEIGQLLGKQTIAEYVEDEAILQRLQELGVDYAQGYYIGRPQPLEQLLNRETED
jgi:diguanylate cyclase (GGDEF)-like protein/PAS domain S-box-containing protein